MSQLNDIKKMNFEITWKLIKIGYSGYENIEPQISKQDICEYAYFLLGNMKSNYNEVVQLITEKENDYEFNESLNKLVKLDNSNMKLQAEKWIIYLTKRMIDSLGDNYFENLLTINEFWISLGQPKNSPHVFQAVENKVTPKEYYTQEMYSFILDKHKKWLKEETQKVIQEENCNN